MATCYQRTETSWDAKKKTIIIDERDRGLYVDGRFKTQYQTG